MAELIPPIGSWVYSTLMTSIQSERSAILKILSAWREEVWVTTARYHKIPNLSQWVLPLDYD